MRILFLISSMRGGGAERVASILCNYWAQQNYGVVMVTFDTRDNDFYNSDDRIKRYSLNCFKTSNNKLKSICSNLQRIHNIRNIVKKEKPDVIISFMDVANILAIISTRFLGIPVLVSERTFPQYFNSDNLYDKLRKFIYKFSDGFIAQTNRVSAWAKSFISEDKVFVIANPLIKHDLLDANVKAENTILAVGRLCNEKGFDMLIQAFAKIHKDYPEWNLRIVGEGDDRQILENLIEQKDLQNIISLPGATKHLHIEYAKAKIFVLSSRVEGFPNVLLEAMSQGMPTISFDCNSGPSDIVVNRENGVLVPANDIDEMGMAIKELISNERLCNHLADNASKTADRYSIEKISKQWVDTMLNVMRINYER